jgi:hypothetical protein
MSFWASENKIAIGQTKVAIPSENGLSYSAGQKIDITIPREIQFFQPKESYLSLDVEIALPTGRPTTRLSFDEYIGGQVLIKDIRVYTQGGTLLEEIQGYNTAVSVMYDYDSNENIRNKRAMTEGTTSATSFYRGTTGGTESDNVNHINCPYYVGVANSAYSDLFNNDDYNKAKLLLPLHTGIFQNDKIFPNSMGLRLEIILEQNNIVFRQLDSVNKNNKMTLNPKFHSLNGSTVPDEWTSGSDADIFYVARDNHNIGVDNFPFVVGEAIKFVNENDFNLSYNNASNMVISQIEVEGAFDGNKGLLKITLDDTYTNNGSTVFPLGSVSGECFLYSANFDNGSAVGGQTYNPTFTVSNVELIVQKLDMPDGYKKQMNQMMKEGGSMVYDFLSYSNFRQTILASDTVANINLPLNFSRAKSILCVPTDSTVRTTGEVLSCEGAYVYNEESKDIEDNHNTRGSLVGIWDNLQNYQFNYNNRLQPSRKISCAKISAKNSIDQQPLVELEKALVQAGIQPRSFKAFQRNCVIGRALALQDGVYDCRGKSFSLQVEYNGTAPQFPKLWNNYVFHLRRLNINADGISVDL